MAKFIRLIVLLPVVGGLLVLSILAFAWSTTAPVEGDDVDPRLVHPARQARVLMAQLFAAGPAGAPELVPAAQRALARAPLEEEPFLIAALAAYDDERYDEAVELLDVARRRSARSKEARFLAVDANLAAGNFAMAAKDLEALLGFRGEQANLARDALVLIAGHPETGPEVLAALEGDKTKVVVLSGLARAGAEPAFLLEAVRTMRAAEAAKDDPQAIGGITRPLIEAGEFVAAYRLWSELSGRGGGSDLLRDPGFKGDVPPPFGWEGRSGSEGYAALGAAGLAGEAYGRRSTELARQFLLLPPGTYRLEADVGTPGDAIEAKVRCQEVNAELAQMRLDRAGELDARFTVPRDCRAQWLEVRARATDPPRIQGFAIESITIVRDAP